MYVRMYMQYVRSTIRCKLPAVYDTTVRSCRSVKASSAPSPGQLCYYVLSDPRLISGSICRTSSVCWHGPIFATPGRTWPGEKQAVFPPILTWSTNCDVPRQSSSTTTTTSFNDKLDIGPKPTSTDILGVKLIFHQAYIDFAKISRRISYVVQCRVEIVSELLHFETFVNFTDLFPWKFSSSYFESIFKAWKMFIV